MGRPCHSGLRPCLEAYFVLGAALGTPRLDRSLGAWTQTQSLPLLCPRPSCGSAHCLGYRPVLKEAGHPLGMNLTSPCKGMLGPDPVRTPRVGAQGRLGVPSDERRSLVIIPNLTCNFDKVVNLPYCSSSSKWLHNPFPTCYKNELWSETGKFLSHFASL